MTRIYLIRHGETTWNTEYRAQGSQDIRLSERGKKQASLLSDRLAKHSIDRIFSSDLSRAYETATIISNKINVPIETIAELREMSFGEWEGLTLDEIKKKYFDHYSIWRSEPHKANIPNGEMLLVVQKRGIAAIKKLLRQYKDNSIAIISHGTINKAIILGLLDIDLSYFYKIKQDNTCLNIIDFESYGPVIKSLNDIAHLE